MYQRHSYNKIGKVSQSFLSLLGHSFRAVVASFPSEEKGGFEGCAPNIAQVSRMRILDFKSKMLAQNTNSHTVACCRHEYFPYWRKLVKIDNFAKAIWPNGNNMIWFRNLRLCKYVGVSMKNSSNENKKGSSRKKIIYIKW